ncbi:MAG TPA: hypothetical protein VMI52_01810 [Acetobacteraceae bacterium]|nr:hypothetical protein [Acetobacteraceae bacterium]
MRNPARHPRTVALMALGIVAFLVPAMSPRDATAQEQPAHPQMSNVIPAGGTGAIEGKIQAIDPTTRLVTIVAKSGQPIALFAGPSVRLDNVEPGDKVDAQYTRDVVFVVTQASKAVPQGATQTVGQMAHTPGGIGPEATQISGRVMKIDMDAHTFDVVDATGGGVYTVQVTDPARIKMMSDLHVGAGVTVSLTPLTITSMVKCGWFGCG